MDLDFRFTLDMGLCTSPKLVKFRVPFYSAGTTTEDCGLFPEQYYFYGAKHHNMDEFGAELRAATMLEF